MSKTYAYCRVSTVEQDTQTQVNEVITANAGIHLTEVVEEEISGGVPAELRPKLSCLLGKLVKGDTLIVTKLDRLGRDRIDVLQTVDRLARAKVHVQVLAFGTTDLASPVGRAMLGMAAVFAEFERDMIRQRTREGMAQVKKRVEAGGSTRTGVAIGAMGAQNIADHNAKLKQAAYEFIRDSGISERLRSYQALGLSQRAMVLRLNEEGMPSPSGGKWHLPTLQKTLKKLQDI